MLYLVPTPVGNLEDITLRALRVLKEADLIACEDTRRTAKLLAHYAISAQTTSYHDRNERQKTPALIAQMEAGGTVALVSDAGSPGISDPGFFLVRACYDAGIPVVPLPGASAVIPAVTASGLPCDRFVFEGFLPARKGRRTRLQHLREHSRTIVLYEAPHRLLRTLEDLIGVLGAARPAAIAREMTKQYEEFQRGTLKSLQESFAERAQIKGEIVIIIGPSQ